MVKDRRVALIYRLISMLIILSALITGSGFAKGAVRFLFYTAQSNIITCAMFFVLSMVTLFDLIKKGYRGSASYAPHLELKFVVMITFNVFVFWGIILPFTGGQGIKMLSWGNFVLHAFSAVLAFFDYLLFCERGHFKVPDALVCCIIPICYIAEAAILGSSGIVFYSSGNQIYHYPYLFMDFERLGAYALLLIAAFALAYIGYSFLIYRLDKKLRINKKIIA